jgi:hypothetical protein
MIFYYTQKGSNEQDREKGSRIGFAFGESAQSYPQITQIFKLKAEGSRRRVQGIYR